MTAIAAEQPRVEKTAWDILENETPNKVEYLPEDRDPRYFFYAGDEPGVPGAGGLRTQSKCIPGLLMKRCDITPCVTVQVPSRVQEIPEGRLIRGTENTPLPGLGKYWLYSGPEAFILVQKYGNRADWTNNRGLVEFDFLRGWEPAKVRSLKIREVFFPNYPNDVPDTNAATLAHIKAVTKEIADGTYINFKWSSTDADSIVRRDIYLKCGEYMAKAVEAADRWQSDKVNQSNLAITLPSTEPGYKRDFDAADELWSKRTGIKLAVNSLRQNSILQGVQNDPATKGIDPEAIAAIVAATVKAVKAADDTPTVPEPVEDKPKGKKAA